jgi:hypothetical protein
MSEASRSIEVEPDMDWMEGGGQTMIRSISIGSLLMALACGGQTDRPLGDSSGGLERGAGDGAAAAAGADGDVGTAGSNGVAAAGGGDAEPPTGTCAQPPLDGIENVIANCFEGEWTAMRCPFQGHATEVNYGPFIGCCPEERPFACANGTPHLCFANAELAAASCGTSCVTCTPAE